MRDDQPAETFGVGVSWLVIPCSGRAVLGAVLEGVLGWEAMPILPNHAKKNLSVLLTD